MQEQAAEGCDLIVVLGGDGTILRGAEFARRVDAPLLGVNLGHVGFLAEAERDDLDATVDHIARSDYAVEERMTLHVDAKLDGELIASSWALNEVSVEKAARERMLEVTLEVDARPLSSWGCDGVIVATPTGSTAYAFSAGGPVVWPQVEAILVVPSAAHALFSRPLVLGPDSHLAVEIKAANEGAGVMWCDGRRHVDLPPGARIEVRRGTRPDPPRPTQQGALHRPPRREVRPVGRRVAWQRPPADPPRVAGRPARAPSQPAPRPGVDGPSHARVRRP